MRYVALLRALNVGGRNIVKMDCAEGALRSGRPRQRQDLHRQRQRALRFADASRPRWKRRSKSTCERHSATRSRLSCDRRGDRAGGSPRPVRRRCGCHPLRGILEGPALGQGPNLRDRFQGQAGRLLRSPSASSTGSAAGRRSTRSSSPGGSRSARHPRHVSESQYGAQARSAGLPHRPRSGPRRGRLTVGGRRPSAHRASANRRLAAGLATCLFATGLPAADSPAPPFFAGSRAPRRRPSAKPNRSSPRRWIRRESLAIFAS